MAVPPLGCNCTIVGDPTTKEAVVVDPGGDVDKILARLAALGLTLKRVLVTHGHLDHILGGRELKEKTGCEIIMHADDLSLYENVNAQCDDFGVPAPATPLPRPDAFVSDGDVIEWAPSYKVRCVHCPGHTPGSTSYHFEEACLVCPGDTLFRGSIGRTSWAGIPSLQGTSDSQQLLGSLKHKLFSLPAETKGERSASNARPKDAQRSPLLCARPPLTSTAHSVRSRLRARRDDDNRAREGDQPVLPLTADASQCQWRGGGGQPSLHGDGPCTCML